MVNRINGMNNIGRGNFAKGEMERLTTTLKGFSKELELPQLGDSTKRFESVLVAPAVPEVRRTIQVSNLPGGQEPSSELQEKAAIYDRVSRGLRGGTFEGLTLENIYDQALDYLAAGLDQFGTPSAKVAFNKLFNRETSEFGFDPRSNSSKLKELYNTVHGEIDERIRNGETPLIVALSILSEPKKRELILETLGEKEVSRILSIASQCLDPGSLLTLLRGYSQPKNFPGTSNVAKEILSSVQEELIKPKEEKPSLLGRLVRRAGDDLRKLLS